ncbi:MAG: site-specific integrase, partial [Mesorhizobium sp.]
TYANPEALRELRRDCMSEHLLLDGRSVISWSKGRSNRVQRRSFLRDKTLSVPNLIDRVLQMTSPLLAHVPAQDRERLFVAETVYGSRTVSLIPSYLMSKHVRLFAQR